MQCSIVEENHGSWTNIFAQIVTIPLKLIFFFKLRSHTIRSDWVTQVSCDRDTRHYVNYIITMLVGNLTVFVVLFRMSLYPRAKKEIYFLDLRSAESKLRNSQDAIATLAQVSSF